MRKNALVVGLSLFFVPHLAFADDCSSIKNVVEMLKQNPEALSRAQDTRGEPLPDDPGEKKFFPTVTLSGAHVCKYTIYKEDETSPSFQTADMLVYSCEWALSSGEEGMEMAASIRDATESCLDMKPEAVDSSDSGSVNFARFRFKEDGAATQRGPGNLAINVSSTERTRGRHAGEARMKYSIKLSYDED